jgi:hypothetical protein
MGTSSKWFLVDEQLPKQEVMVDVVSNRKASASELFIFDLHGFF